MKLKYIPSFRPSISFKNQVIKLNPFTLSFPTDFENLFLKDYFDTSLRHIRVALLLAAFFYGNFAVYDAMIYPEGKAVLWLIRLAVIIPLFLGGLAFSYTRHFKRFFQLGIGISIIWSGAGVILMMMITNPPLNYSYYVGIIFCLIFGYTFLRARFITASITGLILIGIYEFISIRYLKTPYPTLLINSFFMVNINLVGMIVSYTLEYYTRKNFYFTHLLTLEEEKVKAANRTLEETVQKRTEQLAKTNIALKKELAKHTQTEKAMRESEEKYRLLAETAIDFILVHNLAGHITYANKAGLELSGYAEEELLAMSITDLIDHQELEAIAQRSAQRKAGDHSVYLYEIEFINKAQRRVPVEITSSPVVQEDGTISGILIVARDITQRKKMEAEHQQLDLQLRQAQKLEAIGQLTGGIAHDFNNILTAINGFSELLQLRLPADSPLQSMVENILKSGKRATSLISQLLAFSRKQIIEPKIVDINTVITELDKMLRRIINEDIEFQTQLATDIWTVKIDPTQLEQVILNLVVNARDAMPQGGKLILKTENASFSQNFLSEQEKIEAGDYSLLTISDTGTGMDEETKAHIFEPFFSTKMKGKGTGLGLSTVYGIVRQNNGYIRVDSQKEEGTTFSIYFSRVFETADQSPQYSITNATPEGSETIILVEDDPAVLNLSVHTLQERGYIVLPVKNGEDALQMSLTGQGKPDLLITDVVMPNISGKKVAQELGKRFPDLKVLFISGYTDKVISHHGILDTDINFLQKPFSITALTQKVREILDRPG